MTAQSDTASSHSNTPGKMLPAPGEENLFHTQYEVEEIDDKEALPVYGRS